MIKRDRIYKYEFDKIVKKTLGISSKERAYLDEVFASNLAGGLTIAGLRYKIGELYYSKKNIVSHHKLEVIRQNIITELTRPASEYPEKPVPVKAVANKKK
ncbi:MAG: hypothetical protein ABSF55_04000 [Candidatus Staskawiczbacteria bacterium]|jgi:hypothetical protein